MEEEQEGEEEESTGPGQDLLMQQRTFERFHSEDFSLLFPSCVSPDRRSSAAFKSIL